MKTGLVLEGGAMRGMFTAGVLDVFMEQGIDFDGLAGVSAGAISGCSFVSHQIGRTIRYNKKYCMSKDYNGLYSLIRTGDLYGVDFCYRRIPYELDPYDFETCNARDMDFYAVCTDLETGLPVYHNCRRNSKEDSMLWIRASASMPMVSRPVQIGNQKLLDGGLSDSIPLAFMEKQGFEKNVVILTQPKGFIKGQMELYNLVKLSLLRYPKFIQTMEARPDMYNQQTAYVQRRAQEGAAFAIYPPEPLQVGATERDSEKLEKVYQIGRKTAEEKVDALKAFLSKDQNL